MAPPRSLTELSNVLTEGYVTLGFESEITRHVWRYIILAARRPAALAAKSLALLIDIAAISRYRRAEFTAHYV